MDEKQLFQEWRNERAFLQQKIEIQEMYIQEAKQREENLKKMNETFLSTIMQPQGDNVTLKFQKTYELEQINRQKDIIEGLQVDIKCLEDKLNEKESQIKTFRSCNEKELISLQQKLIDSETQRINWERKFKEQNNQDVIQKLNQEHDLQIKELQNQLNQLKIKHQGEIEKQRNNFESQIRKLKLQSNSQPKKDPEELIKLKEENKRLKNQIKSQENSIKVIRQSKNDSDQLEEQMKDLEQQNLNLNKALQDTQNKYNKAVQQQDQFKNQITQLNSQLEEARNARYRNQSPSHPTTRLRTTQQLQNTFNESQYATETDLSTFLQRIQKPPCELENQMKDIQQKLYNAKKKITTTTPEECSFIRQSIQKIKNRSRNQSISVNENDPIIYESNKVNDSVEYRNHSNSLCYDKLFRY
ncbi:hypothetical protein pb186bvf_004323 [Paramecium bursaria]